MDSAAPAQSTSKSYIQAASVLHTVIVVLLLTAWAVLGWVMVHRIDPAANPHRMRTYALTLVFEWILFAYVVAGVVRYGEPARLVVGRSWRSLRGLFLDIGIAATFWLVAGMVLAVVGRLLHAGAGRDLQFLLPQGGAELALWVALSVSAGICEETIFRGYLQCQFMAFTKSAPAGILLSAVAFGAGHAYQGLRMMILIAVYGVLFGLLAHWRGSVRPGMIAHAWQDSINGIVANIKIR